MKYFSVKSSVKINGKCYIPCVCYELPSFLEPTLNKMVSEEKAVIYDEKVFFQNGAVIKTKKMLKAEQKEAKKKAKKEVFGKVDNSDIPESLHEIEGF